MGTSGKRSRRRRNHRARIVGLSARSTRAACDLEQTSALLRAIPVPLVVLDDRLAIRSASLAYCDRYEVEPASAIGRPWLETSNGAWDSPRLRQALLDLLATGGERPVEIEVACQGRTVAVTACVLRREVAAPLLIVTPLDVTEKTRLLRTAAEARAEAERANEAKDLFLAILSDELRAPLHTIQLHADLLLESAADPARSWHSADAIVRAAQAQARIVGDLLDVSAIVTGRIAIRRRPVALQGVIAAALDGIRQQAARKQIRLAVAIDPQMGPVLGDNTRLQQIVGNLLGNAVQFTPEEGEISVSLDQVDHRARIEVSDTGLGIAAERLDRVFDRFAQPDPWDVGSEHGPGFGLAVVHHLVRLHGGTVRAASDGPGLGATFTIELPLLATRRMRARSAEPLVFTAPVHR